MLEIVSISLDVLCAVLNPALIVLILWGWKK